MKKISKSNQVPASLRSAPVPSCVVEVNPCFYKADDVREQLIKDQYGKCAYCECRVTMAYNDVDHYRPKSIYYWLGHEWSNLLYACPTCNRSCKKDSFPLRDERARNVAERDISQESPLIVNPTLDDPKKHIQFRKYMAVGVSIEGKYTVELFKLNDRPSVLDDRKRLYEEYESEKLKMEVAEFLVQMLTDSEQLNWAHEVINLTKKSLGNLMSPENPYSGMLLAQM